MKKFSILITLIILLSSCNNPSVSTGAKISSTNEEGYITKTGRVSLVSGNDITLALGSYTHMDRPSANEGNGPKASKESPGATQNSHGSNAAMPSNAAPEMVEESPRASKSTNSKESTASFKENGEEITIRIPVGTPIVYGSLSVDFSQIQNNYIVSITFDDAQNIISGEIISTT